MKKVINNYKSMLILLGSIIVGGLVGLIWGESAQVLNPFGEIFLNMLLVVVVPLIFLTIVSSIYKMKHPGRIGKILVTTFLMFLVTSVVAVLIGIVSTYSFKLVNSRDGDLIKDELSDDLILDTDDEANFLERTVEALTVDDFSDLFTRDNMIALIVISILMGLAMNMSGTKALAIANVIDSLLFVLVDFIKIIMYTKFSYNLSD